MITNYFFKYVSLALISIVVIKIDAQSVSFQQKVLPSDGTISARFGSSIDVSGDFAVVGAAFDSGSIESGGAAYIFHKENNEWRQVRKLINSDQLASDNFGWTCAIDGRYVVISAWGKEEETGAVYIFENDGKDPTKWDEVAKLSPEDLSEGDDFGWDLDISGNLIIVSAPDNTETGAVYVFEKKDQVNDWVEISKLKSPGENPFESFGVSVAIDSSTAAVGSQAALNIIGTNVGAVYIFNQNEGGANNWGNTQQLFANNDQESSFGWRVDLDENYLISGAPVDDDNNGAAYIFENPRKMPGNWTKAAKLIPPGPKEEFRRFGLDVAIQANTKLALIGSPFDDRVNFKAGASYTYQRNDESWELAHVLKAEDGKEEDYFGLEVGMDGSHILNAAYTDDNGDESGSVYFYSVNNEVVGTQDLINPNVISLYPNPSSDFILVQINSKNFNDWTLNITNNMGNVLMDMDNKGHNDLNTPIYLDLSEIPSGMYHATLSTDRGVATRKIIVKK